MSKAKERGGRVLGFGVEYLIMTSYWDMVKNYGGLDKAAKDGDKFYDWAKSKYSLDKGEVWGLRHHVAKRLREEGISCE